jgi:AcrR family transcriptional regulator
VTLEEIAARAEVSVMTVYRRFRARPTRPGRFRPRPHHRARAHHSGAHRRPWQDLVGVLEAVTGVLAQRQVIISLAHEFEAFANESTHRFLHAIEPVLRRAIDAGVVRPELLPRDLNAITFMSLATVHPGDPDGDDRRRYLALLVDGLRPSPTTLPPPAQHDFFEPP